MTPTRYPLQWPTGWKRTNHFDRQHAKFGKASRYEGHGENKRWVSGRDLTVSEAIGRVQSELKRMGIGIEDAVVSTNLRTRLDGLPRSDQREPDDPGAAVYWETARGERKVMAIDLYLRVADNLAAVAATLEAMRAIERHGGAAILDRAFTGFTALPAPIVAGMKRPWREVLGFRPDGPVNRDDVQTMYRHQASLHHPDRAADTADRAQRERRMAEINAARDEALQELGHG